MYVAHEKLCRDHSSRLFPRVAFGFVVSMALAILYFIAKYDIGKNGNSTAYFTVIISVLCIVIGALIPLFVVKYE